MSITTIIPNKKSNNYAKLEKTDTTVEVWLHVILTTKNNKPLMHKDWRSKFAYYLKRTARENGIFIDYVSGVEDHLHFLMKADLNAKTQVVINKIKRFAPQWFKENKVMKRKFAWEKGCAVFSVSPSQVGEVRAYIKDQEYFHKEFPLSDELIILQKK